MTVVTGSVDAVAELVVPTHQDLVQVLVHELPATDQVIESETLAVMRTFTSVHDWDTHLLEPDAVALLRPAPAQPFEDQVWEQPPDRLDPLEPPSPRPSEPTDGCR